MCKSVLGSTPSTQVGRGIFPQAARSRILFARPWPPKILHSRVYLEDQMSFKKFGVDRFKMTFILKVISNDS